MKDKVEIVKNNVKINKKIFVFLTVLTIIGILFGSFFVVILNDTDKALVTNYINDFIKNINSGKINYINNYININVESLFFILTVWFLGISIIGLPVMLFLYFCKAFVVGFSVAAFILNYNLKGIILSFIYIIPHTLVQFFLYIILLNYALTLSLKLATSFIQRKTINFKGIIQKYGLVLIVVVIGILIINAYEIFIVPKIFKLILPILNIK